MPLPTTNGNFTGKLRASEKRKAIETLARKGMSQPPCELCQNKSWMLGDYIVSPEPIGRDFSNAGFGTALDPYHPSLLLFCTNCGNTKFLNANILGAFDLYAAEGEPGD